MNSLLSLFRHVFLPHHSNNQRAKLLHHTNIFAIAACLLVLGTLLSHLKMIHPKVLGTSVDISAQELLLLTNQERAKVGAEPLTLNSQLSTAAFGKANYMFAKNFWAHIAPDGKTPWDFIKAAQYSYVYAGENLARGFTNAPDVVSAWMASPDHRANMLSKNYQEVGFAVEKGSLTGEQDTILVVEMLGGQKPIFTEKGAPAEPATKTVLAEGASQQQNSLVINAPIVDTFVLARNLTLFILGLFIIVFVVDGVFIHRRKIARIVGHNMDHILFLVGILVILLIVAKGAIF